MVYLSSQMLKMNARLKCKFQCVMPYDWFSLFHLTDNILLLEVCSFVANVKLLKHKSYLLCILAFSITHW